jgi:hypothetical protein
MHTVTIRFSDTQFMFVATMSNSETEGIGDSISDALRDLADNMDAAVQL